MIFREVFAFGKDVLLMSLGGQLVNATQLMIISRCVGLDAAAAFSIGTKLYTMGTQLVSRIMETSTPALTEMFVHGDLGRLKHRFWNVVSISILASCLFGSGMVMANHAVVEIWTSNVIRWNFTADILLGGLIFSTSITRCFVSMFGVIGNYGSIRHIYAMEGVIFLLLGIPAAKLFGIIGVLSASLIAHFATSFPVVLIASFKYLQSCRKLVQSAWPALIILTASCFVSLLAQKGALSCINTLLLVSLLGVPMAAAGWRYVLDAELRREVLGKIRSILPR